MNNEQPTPSADEKSPDDQSPEKTKTQDLTKAKEEGFDPNEGEE